MAALALFLIFLALAAIAKGEVGDGIGFGMLAWGVLAFGSNGSGGNTGGRRPHEASRHVRGSLAGGEF